MAFLMLKEILLHLQPIPIENPQNLSMSSCLFVLMSFCPFDKGTSGHQDMGR